MSEVINRVRYDIFRLQRDKRDIVATDKTIEEARQIIGSKHPASELPLFWISYGINYLAVTADGVHHDTPFVARWLIQRSA